MHDQYQLEQQTNHLLMQAKSTTSSRMSVYENIHALAPNARDRLLALCLYTHEQLVNSTSQQTRDHEGMLLTVIGLIMHSSATEDDAVFQQSTMFLQPLIKQLLVDIP